MQWPHSKRSFCWYRCSIYALAIHYNVSHPDLTRISSGHSISNLATSPSPLLFALNPFISHIQLQSPQTTTTTNTVSLAKSLLRAQFALSNILLSSKNIALELANSSSSPYTLASISISSSFSQNGCSTDRVHRLFSYLRRRIYTGWSRCSPVDLSYKPERCYSRQATFHYIYGRIGNDTEIHTYLTVHAYLRTNLNTQELNKMWDEARIIGTAVIWEYDV